MRSHALLMAGLLIATPAAGQLNVPDPAHSSVPRSIVFCPEGDLSAEVIVRDFAGDPIPGALVAFAFSNCFVHCARLFPSGVSNLTVDEAGKVLYGVTDAEGRVIVRVSMTGTCPGSPGDPTGLNVYADGVPLRYVNFLMSPDQNGDLTVDAADEAIMNAKIASPFWPNTATADLNGDGALDVADLTFLQRHSAHVCDDATRVRYSGWGQLKLLYR